MAVHKKLLNIKDVYDEKELAQYSSHLRFLQEVDKRTGYRTKQMLVAPIKDGTTGDLIGVIQVINNKAGTSLYADDPGGSGGTGADHGGGVAPAPAPAK